MFILNSYLLKFIFFSYFFQVTYDVNMVRTKVVDLNIYNFLVDNFFI
jgi:hypothetical protein